MAVKKRKILLAVIILCVGLAGFAAAAMAARRSAAIDSLSGPKSTDKGILWDMGGRICYKDLDSWAGGLEILDRGEGYDPESPCTMERFLTYFWRSCGAPETALPNPFTDISEGDDVCQPALWAYKLGIVSGGTLAPDESCSWEEALACLWRAAGSPTTSAGAAGGSDAQAYAWASEKKLLSGDVISETALTCADAAGLLFRAWKNPRLFPPMDRLAAAEALYASPVIAHAMGAPGEIPTRLNCLESFELEYAAGVRVFEVDLLPTRDGQIALHHGWGSYVRSMDEFLSHPLREQYTPLSFRDLLELMAEYPDFCVITDTKYTDEADYLPEFAAIVGEAEEMGLSYLFGRMAVQVYSADMYRKLDAAYDFPWYVYTLYAEGFDETAETFREKAAFCAEEGILGITMWDFWWHEEFKPIADEYGIQVYVHTVNNLEKARALLDSGVNAVYTDTLIPSQLR